MTTVTNSTGNWNITQPCGFGTGSSVRLPVFGGSALLPARASFTAAGAGSAADAAMTAIERTQHTQGTQVWSPPT